jgi:uncharacterized phage infection (PIP) family protein YhgE
MSDRIGIVRPITDDDIEEINRLQEELNRFQELLRRSRPDFLILEELRLLRREIKEMSTSTLAGLSALQTAVTDLSTAVTTETANVQTAVADIQNAVTLLGQSEDPQVQQLAAQIEAQVGLINTANSNLATAASSLPAPSPAPTPAPSPAPASAQEEAVQSQAEDIAGKPDTGTSQPLEAGKVHYH